jgi:predicted membrane protein
LFFGHIAAIVAAPYFIIQFEKAMDVILILCPLTGAALTLIVQYYADAMVMTKDRTEAVLIDPNTAGLAIGFAVLLVVLLLGVQYYFYAGRIESLDSLKRAVSIIDTVIGVYLITLVRSLFKLEGAAGIAK